MKPLRRFTLLLVVLCPLFTGAQPIETILKERVDAGETPGIVVAFHQNGMTTFYHVGYADVASQRLVDSKTLFEIGSITKTFTTIMIAQLAEEGKIKLKDPVQNFLPSGVTMPTRNGRSITFEDLATASSGLPRMPNNMTPADNENPYIDYTEDKLWAFLSGYTLTRDIGSQYEYSNLGMGLLGVLVARIDGKTYRESVTKRILKPLRMNETFMNTPGRKDKNAATGYSDGKPVKAWTWTDASCIQGAGGLLSNAEDMMKYLLANLKPSTNSLGKAMINSHQPRLDIGRNNMKIALGWHTRNKIIWHNGGTGGFRTFAGYEPEKKMAVVVLTNSNLGADDIGFHLMDESIPLKQIKRPIPVAVELLQSYVGSYEITPQFKIEVTLENGQLFAQATNQPKFGIYAESDTRFFLRVVDATVDFVKGADGKIEKLVLYQNGQAMNGMRKP
ncbi:MAG: serine hydrolase [Cyclobacteriaceae bacterium]|nr:serine hydrolase [Cyclobacteriaceae bacterium]